MNMLERSILSHPRGGREIIVKMISDWLNENTIIVGTHSIDDQYNIDVKGTVVIINKRIKKFPSYIKFNKVSNHFNCNSCSELSSLKGTPKEVGGSFDYTSCKSLYSLEGCPKKVGGYFKCIGCDRQFSINEVRVLCKGEGDYIG